MFVVMKVQDFEFESKGWKPPYPVTFDMGKMTGYLPVYETREDAEKDYPEASIVEARLVTTTIGGNDVTGTGTNSHDK